MPISLTDITQLGIRLIANSSGSRQTERHTLIQDMPYVSPGPGPWCRCHEYAFAFAYSCSYLQILCIIHISFPYTISIYNAINQSINQSSN